MSGDTPTLQRPSDVTRLSWGAAVREAVRPRALTRTVPAALIVGTTLWGVNLSHLYFSGHVTVTVGAQTVLTYVVPWLNATFGMTMAYRTPFGVPYRREPAADSTEESEIHTTRQGAH